MNSGTSLQTKSQRTYIPHEMYVLVKNMIAQFKYHMYAIKIMIERL